MGSGSCSLILVGGGCGLERVLILVGGGCGLERVLILEAAAVLRWTWQVILRTEQSQLTFCTLLLLLGVFELLFWLLAGFLVTGSFSVSACGFLLAGWFSVSTIDSRNSSSALRTVASSPIARILAVYSSPLHRTRHTSPTDGMAGSSMCFRCMMLTHSSTSNRTR